VEEADRGEPGAEEALQLTKDRAAWKSVVHHAANVCDSE